MIMKFGALGANHSRHGWWSQWCERTLSDEVVSFIALHDRSRLPMIRSGQDACKPSIQNQDLNDTKRSYAFAKRLCRK